MGIARHFVGFVDSTGRFALDDKAGFRKACLTHAGQEVLLTIKKKPRWQGDKQGRYYRGVVIPDIAEACGYDRDDPQDCEAIHQSMSWKHLRISDHPELGYPRRRSTAKGDLSLEEMAAYIDAVILDAETSIVGCRIRRPEEVDMDKIHAPEAA